KLYTVTKLGTTVIIADNKSSPVNTTKPGLLFSGTTTTQAGPMPAGFTWTPEKAPNGPVSVIVSTADRTGYVFRNGVEIGRASIGGVERLSGTHIYAALATVDASGKRNWISTRTAAGRPPNPRNRATR